MSNVLEINDLHASFAHGFWMQRKPVLKGVNLKIKSGEVLGFLGPNGAGKTTTIKIILGLMKADKGHIDLWGQPIGPPALRVRVGYLPEQPYFYKHLRGKEFLGLHADLAGLAKQGLAKRIEQVLDLCGIPQVAKLPLGSFSKGMLQRIGLAQALIHEPEFLILDEPMSGLDPLGRKQIREILLKLKAQGKTLFFSSHIVHDVEMLCDRVVILNHGKLKNIDDINALVRHKDKNLEDILLQEFSS